MSWLGFRAPRGWARGLSIVGGWRRELKPTKQEGVDRVGEAAVLGSAHRGEFVDGGLGQTDGETDLVRAAHVGSFPAIAGTDVRTQSTTFGVFCVL